MNPAKPTNRVVWPKIHLRKGFISISTNDWKPKIGIRDATNTKFKECGV